MSKIGSSTRAAAAAWVIVQGAASAATCMVDIAADRSIPDRPPPYRTVITTPQSDSSSNAYTAYALQSRVQPTADEQERQEMVKAIQADDIAAVRRLVPPDPPARREKLRQGLALNAAYVHGRLSIARQILAWDPGALEWELLRSKGLLLDWTAYHWEARQRSSSSPVPLHERDYVELIRLALDHGASADGGSSDGNTAPLKTLAHMRDTDATVDAARLLLQRGASSGRPAIRPPLTAAADAGNGRMAALLIQMTHPTKPALDDAIAWAPLRQESGAIEPLLDAGADANAISDKNELTRKRRKTAIEAAWRAANLGERELMRMLLRYPLDLSAPSGDKSAVDYLVRDPELLALALQAGGDPNHVSTNGDTPLLLATRVHKWDPHDMHDVPPPDPEARLLAVRALLHAGANPAMANAAGITPLMQTMRDEEVLVAELLAKGGTVNLDSPSGRLLRGPGLTLGPVSWAAANGEDALAAALFRKSGSLARDDCGAFFYAAVSGSTRTLEALIASKLTDGATSNSSGITPLMVAAERGHVAVVKMLLDHKLANLDDATPRITQDFSLSFALAGHASHPPVGYLGGETALMKAARARQLEVVRELVRHGANVQQKDFAGAVAWQYIGGRPDPEMAALLAAPYR